MPLGIPISHPTVRDVFDRYLSKFDRRPRIEQAWPRHVDIFLKLSGLTWGANVHEVDDVHVEDFILARNAGITHRLKQKINNNAIAERYRFSRHCALGQMDVT